MTRLFDRYTNQFKVFSHFLAIAEVDFWCIYAWDKQTYNMDTTSSKRDQS